VHIIWITEFHMEQSVICSVLQHSPSLNTFGWRVTAFKQWPKPPGTDATVPAKCHDSPLTYQTLFNNGKQITSYYSNIILYSTETCISSSHGRDLVGTNDKYNIVEICRATNVMFNLVKPRVQRIKAGSVRYIIDQQSSLSVGVELITNLKHPQSRLPYSYHLHI